MIFKVHYVLFNAGLSAISILLTVFLRKYSDTSPTEIGALLMALPFVSVIAKPLFCAIADRLALAGHSQAHRMVFVVSLFVLLCGYGSFVFVPYFPDFVQNHGRMAWWVFVGLTIVGYTAFGVIWSLGDAFVVNMCRRRSQSFGMYRLWGTMSWGVFGLAIGQFNQGIPGIMPEYTPAFFVMIVAVSIEIVAIMLWPRKEDFILGDLSPTDNDKNKAVGDNVMDGDENHHIEHDNNDTVGSQFKQNIRKIMARAASIQEHVPTGSCSGIPGNMGDSLRLSTSQAKCIVNMSDVNNGTISSMVKRRTGLDQIRFGSLSKRPSIWTSTDSAHNTLTRASTFENKLVRQDAFNGSTNNSSGLVGLDEEKELKLTDIQNENEQQERQQDLQWAIFKMIATRDKMFCKHFGVFVIFGALFNIHISFFLLHLEELTQESGVFNQLVGMCLMSQAIAETICFMIVPKIIKCLGVAGSTCFCLVLFSIRYFFYGLVLNTQSPFVILVFEPMHGICYGIVYYLVTDIALYFALKADDLVPELIEKKIIDKDFDKSAIQSSVRATMQGVFSGAFDGFGCGFGALLAGLILEYHKYEYLWCLCGIISSVAVIVYGLNRSTCARTTTIPVLCRNS
ncbi:hypothetical protein GZH46_01197 [Fragariocoptes setiger]|uniref:Major facilitator superfamily associated domain-containing protein n=1 Tax=Fragariocoptes setiger TaxID=1670756 RepID=A0ABQ7SA31_9ACAR|nr:hypothetical protein GZH46_01197 [Fragariocoptes setiger]